MRLNISMTVCPSNLLRLYWWALICILGVVAVYAGMQLHKLIDVYAGIFVFFAIFLLSLALRPHLILQPAFYLTMDVEGLVYLQRLDGELHDWESGVVDSDSSVTVWALFVLLYIRDEVGIRRRVLIFRDSVTKNEFRRARVLLLSLAQRRRDLVLSKNDISDGNF